MIAALAILLATVTSTASSVSYSCNGTTTAYAVPFSYLAGTLTATSTTAGGVVTGLVVTTDYSVSPVAAPSTGTLTLVAGSRCPAGSTLLVARTVPLTQPTSFRGGAYQGAAHEQAFDRLTMQVQRIGVLASATNTGLLTAADWALIHSAVQTASAASLSSLSLTTPLALGSGGSGASLGPCGSGFLTVVGTQMVCQVPVGLGAPGSSGVLLQATTPGALQTGHINISGTLLLGGGGTFQSSINNQSNGGLVTLGTGVTGSNVTLAKWVTPFDLNNAAISFRTNGAGEGQILIQPHATGLFPVIAAASARQMIFSGGGGLTTFNITASGTQGIVIDTSATRGSGKLLEVNNNTVNKFAVDFAGVTTTTGLTSTGPVSGTTGTFTGAVSGTTGTFSSSATIGGGQAITGSYRNIITLGVVSIPAQSCRTDSITVAGTAFSGAECAISTPGLISGTIAMCETAINSCIITTCNVTTGALNRTAGDYSCRTFNH